MRPHGWTHGLEIVTVDGVSHRFAVRFCVGMRVHGSDACARVRVLACLLLSASRYVTAPPFVYFFYIFLSEDARACLELWRCRARVREADDG